MPTAIHFWSIREVLPAGTLSAATLVTRIRSWHRFFSEWLAALRFTSEKKDPTRGPPGDRRGSLSVCAIERRA